VSLEGANLIGNEQDNGSIITSHMAAIARTTMIIVSLAIAIYIAVITTGDYLAKQSAPDSSQSQQSQIDNLQTDIY
jgi:hypothetical protein